MNPKIWNLYPRLRVVLYIGHRASDGDRNEVLLVTLSCCQCLTSLMHASSMNYEFPLVREKPFRQERPELSFNGVKINWVTRRVPPLDSCLRKQLAKSLPARVPRPTLPLIQPKWIPTHPTLHTGVLAAVPAAVSFLPYRPSFNSGGHVCNEKSKHAEFMEFG